MTLPSSRSRYLNESLGGLGKLNIETSTYVCACARRRAVPSSSRPVPPPRGPYAVFVLLLLLLFFFDGRPGPYYCVPVQTTIKYVWVQHSCSLRDPRWDLTKKTHETSSKGINSSARTHSSKGFGRRGRGHTIPRLCRGSSSGSVAESNTCSWGQQVTVFLYSNKSQFSCSGAQPVAPAGPVPLQRLPQIRLLHLCLEHK